jgi:hypothetical protein
MYFTSRGLEQATDEIVARHKAARFARDGRVVDLCCGVGGDLAALAERGPTLAVDRDPILACLAEANLAALRAADPVDGDRSPPRVLVEDVAAPHVAEADAWHIDPDRRPAGRRTTRVELGEPGPETIAALLAANPHGAIKLAPAAVTPLDWAERAEQEWISSRGECRQLVAWFGDLAARPGERRATALRSGPGDPGSGVRALSSSFVGRVDVVCPVAERLGAYLFEPDAAVLAADLTAALAAARGLAALVPRGAYLTGERAIDEPLLAAFAVEEALPFDLRRVKALLRERRIGRLEVKQRGTDLDPADVQRQLRVDGDEQRTLILTRAGRRVTAILARRMP